MSYLEIIPISVGKYQIYCEKLTQCHMSEYEQVDITV